MSLRAEQQKTKRQKSAAPGSMHDRIVRMLRVVLPAIVGVMLAVLIFSPFAEQRELSFLLAKDAVDKAKERMRVSTALYRGEDNKGQPFSVRAGEALQKSSSSPAIDLRDVSASMYYDGTQASAQAANGSYDTRKEILSVVGPLKVNDGKGNAAAATEAMLYLNERRVDSTGPLTYTQANGDRVAGEKLSYWIDEEHVRSQGPMNFISAKGYSVTASNISYWAKARKLESFGAVSGFNRIGSFSANKLLADLEGRVITLRGNARLTINQGVLKSRR